MFESLKIRLLGWLRVPPEPKPPQGSPESIRVFRAAPNYFKLLRWKWGLAQLAAALGFVVWLVVFQEFGEDWGRNFRRGAQTIELIALAGFVVQLPFTFLAVRLEYELRWYIVTDRSLRLRSGIWTVREMTLTFANIQQTTIRQGPLQRLLGIADLKVTTAGGGGVAGAAPGHAREDDSMHTGFLHGIDNAAAIRDLIQERLRRLRDSGLGDPEEGQLPPPDGPVPPVPGALEAARELLEETRRLRQALRAGSATT
jgi:membrane protein YdbS with pleckstrin-like domain